jgi:hypothetical protein
MAVGAFVTIHACPPGVALGIVKPVYAMAQVVTSMGGSVCTL